MAKKLPTKLEKVPLSEAVCELRIGGTVPLHNVVPGLLLAKYPGQVREVMPLPAASIPEAIRAADASFAHVALTRFTWRDLTVLVGNRVLTITHAPPYLGWKTFKERITEILGATLSVEITPVIERYSLRYQNLFKFEEDPKPADILDLTLKLGSLELKPGATFLRCEVVDNDLITIVQVVQSVALQVEGKAPSQGMLVDVDTVSSTPPIPCTEFLRQMSDRLEKIRLVNKTVFFECLRDEAIKALGATYVELH
jgi:uncharacterized protein (TIGR04255 family)